MKKMMIGSAKDGVWLPTRALQDAIKTGDPTKEGRHVVLDFYDLLIEAIEAAAEATKLSELSVERVAWRLRERAGRNASER